MVVSASVFRSEGRWYEVQSLPSGCFLGQETLPPHCLSPPRCIKWVVATYCRGVTLRWTSIPSKGGGGVAILSVPSCYRNRDKLQPCGPPWLVCNFTYLYHTGGGKLWSCLLHATDTEVKMPTLRSHLVSSGYWIGQRT